MTHTVEIQAPAEQAEGTRLQVLRWLKAVGDSVVEHEPLIEIETDKVTVEVAAPASGVLREIVKGESEEVAPGEVLGRLELAPSDGAAPKVAVTSEAAAPAVSQARDDETTSARATVNLSPAVRRLISERGLDPLKIRGSGEGGRITVDDVLAYSVPAGPAEEISIDDVLESTGVYSIEGISDDEVTSIETKNTASSGVTGSGDVPSVEKSAGGDLPSVSKSAAGAQSSKAEESISAHNRPHGGTLPSHAVPHTAIRKRTAAHMVQSLLETSPHVTTVFEADLTAMMSHRSKHRADFDSRGGPLTFTAYFIAASVAGIRAVPEANARWTDTATEIYDTINIGVATALPEVGLVVPVLHDLAHKSLFEIAKTLNERVTAARAGKLQPADVRGGTFTISNHGVSGSLVAAPIIINQPQSAILGIGKLEKRAVVIEENGEDKIVARPKCYVTLTIDHRVMDGHQANRFLQVFVETLEHWPRD